jgi:hypothetical protein
MNEDISVNGFTSGLIAGDVAVEPAPAGIIEKVKSFFSPQVEKLERQRDDLCDQQEELDRKFQETDAVWEKYRSMVLNRDRLTERLRVADEQFASAKVRREQLSGFLTAGWGTSPETMPCGPAYANLISLDAAIAAFPEARQLIADELAQAEKLVRDFEREQSRP